MVLLSHVDYNFVEMSRHQQGICRKATRRYLDTLQPSASLIIHVKLFQSENPSSDGCHAQRLIRPWKPFDPLSSSAFIEVSHVPENPKAENRPNWICRGEEE